MNRVKQRVRGIGRDRYIDRGKQRERDIGRDRYRGKQRDRETRTYLKCIYAMLARA